MLLRKELINLELVQKILLWHHTGFNVHSKVRTRTREEVERAGKHMIRPILSLKSLSFDETEGKVSYQYRNARAEEEQMDYLSASTCAVGIADRCNAQAGLEFIARVTSHIPDKGQVMVRYYGLC